MPRQAPTTADPGRSLDLTRVKGQEAAKRALEVAAAGGHPVLLVGPPGSGKTLLCHCLPGLLPPPTGEEAARIADTYRRAKLDPPEGRPFRVPHHSTKPLDLVGRRRPREVDLARGGVLLLDDLQAFGRRHLRALRRPLEATGAPGTEPRASVPPDRPFWWPPCARAPAATSATRATPAPAPRPSWCATGAR